MADAMFKEDAERLAEQIVDENQMVDIIDVKMDPDRGNYVIVAYDYGTDEEILVDGPETWAEKKSELARKPVASSVTAHVREKHGRIVGSLLGHWTEVNPNDWPDEICDAVEERRVPGEALADLEPALADAEIVYPGKGKPDDYGLDGDYLVMVSQDGAKVFRHIIKLANFTLADQSAMSAAWRQLGFDISPQPLAPMVEPSAEEWGEKDVADEVRDRLLDVLDKGYGAILVDGQTNVSAYAWVLAGVVGLKVIMAWEQRGESTGSAFAGMGYAEMLHYKEIEEIF
jgi:hypothetical protein